MATVSKPGNPGDQGSNTAAVPAESIEPTPGTGPAGREGVDKLAGLGYEQARDELAAAVQRLEAGGLSLEESLTLWERGEILAAHCQAKLDSARARLDAAAGGRSG